MKRIAEQSHGEGFRVCLADSGFGVQLLAVMVWADETWFKVNGLTGQTTV